ncbi:hypothetical protein [Gemmobacter sp. 24YEA27]|uniref:hypothetical protein n=1 Tax=Gemmobacter sp. 24YEA27 TaxID=3040672 RepID=UPI0024B34242|nr:hypothetical protein [Gemmobacter sp. 24YEA27]
MSAHLHDQQQVRTVGAGLCDQPVERGLVLRDGRAAGIIDRIGADGQIGQRVGREIAKEAVKPRTLDLDRAVKLRVARLRRGG